MKWEISTKEEAVDMLDATIRRLREAGHSLELIERPEISTEISEIFKEIQDARIKTGQLKDKLSEVV
jgi:hypothetical protein